MYSCCIGSRPTEQLAKALMEKLLGTARQPLQRLPAFPHLRFSALSLMVPASSPWTWDSLFWSCKVQLFWQEDHPHSIEQGDQWCYMVLLSSSVKALQCLLLCGFKDYHLRVWSDTGTDANHYIQYTSPNACAGICANLVDFWVIWPYHPTFNGLISGNRHETSH